MSGNLFQAAFDCLTEAEVSAKLARAHALHEDLQGGRLRAESIDLPDVVEPGRPDRPVLVAPRELPRRRLGSPDGVAAMLHAIAHIEFNAINLACDAVYRFRDLPVGYYSDWVRVAAEEAYHFSLLAGRLEELGRTYGDFPAHDGLWDLALKTRQDPLVRMAMVPRVMEARGLDVTPDMIERFETIRDTRSADILRIILRDEIGHVEAGSRWFGFLCEQDGLDREDTYFRLLQRFFSGNIQCPLHLQARRQAGFSEPELDRLQRLCRGGGN
jgi:uncharacterized ferritin-like protein (DUF455 family)